MPISGATHVNGQPTTRDIETISEPELGRTIQVINDAGVISDSSSLKSEDTAYISASGVKHDSVLSAPIYLYNDILRQTVSKLTINGKRDKVNPWSAVATYNTGDVVQYNNYDYVALFNSLTGNSPDYLSPQGHNFWERLIGYGTTSLVQTVDSATGIPSDLKPLAIKADSGTELYMSHTTLELTGNVEIEKDAKYKLNNTNFINTSKTSLSTVSVGYPETNTGEYYTENICLDGTYYPTLFKVSPGATGNVGVLPDYMEGFELRNGILCVCDAERDATSYQFNNIKCKDNLAECDFYIHTDATILASEQTILEVRNSDAGSQTRFGFKSDASGTSLETRGHAIISSDFIIDVIDEDGNDIHDATIYVPDIQTLEYNVNGKKFNIDSTIGEDTEGTESKFSDTNFVLTTSGTKTTGIIAYWQFPFSMNFEDRVADTAGIAHVLSDRPWAFIRRTGYKPMELRLDLRGTGTKRFSVVMEEDVTYNQDATDPLDWYFAISSRANSRGAYQVADVKDTNLSQISPTFTTLDDLRNVLVFNENLLMPHLIDRTNTKKTISNTFGDIMSVNLKTTLEVRSKLTMGEKFHTLIAYDDIEFFTSTSVECGLILQDDGKVLYRNCEAPSILVDTDQIVKATFVVSPDREYIIRAPSASLVKVESTDPTKEVTVTRVYTGTSFVNSGTDETLNEIMEKLNQLSVEIVPTISSIDHQESVEKINEINEYVHWVLHMYDGRLHGIAPYPPYEKGPESRSYRNPSSPPGKAATPVSNPSSGTEGS